MISDPRTKTSALADAKKRAQALKDFWRLRGYEIYVRVEHRNPRGARIGQNGFGGEIVIISNLVNGLPPNFSGRSGGAISAFNKTPPAFPATRLTTRVRTGGWTYPEERQLIKYYRDGMMVKDIAQMFRCTTANVHKKIRGLRKAGEDIPRRL